MKKNNNCCIATKTSMKKAFSLQLSSDSMAIHPKAKSIVVASTLEVHSAGETRSLVNCWLALPFKSHDPCWMSLRVLSLKPFNCCYIEVSVLSVSPNG